jgi:hypothetical protein
MMRRFSLNRCTFYTQSAGSLLYYESLLQLTLKVLRLKIEFLQRFIWLVISNRLRECPRWFKRDPTANIVSLFEN